MEDYKEYRELTLEEKMKVYENYQKWFATLSEEEKKNTDEGGFETFEEFNEMAYWINSICNVKTFEIVG